jgi:hypothetical protein
VKRLILLHTLLFSVVAHAILDTNNNGLSDLWEKQYNDGQLFSPTNPEHLPNADPDLDGWDNRTEAAAGTDPSLANPPEGIVANTLLPSATAGAYTLTWPTRIGKRYQLQASTDLENWLPVGNPIIAENTSHSIGINVTEPGSPTPPKLFWHITIDDIDSDSDGLTNNEEHQLGTNPNSPDSDGDGLPDSWELNHNLNPNDSADAADPFPDSSLSNLQAYAAGVQANPNATIADKDGDGVDNSDDAAPDDGTIDWKRTANPHFAVIELPVTDVESLRLDDFSENGTVLFTRVQASAPVHRVLVDRQFAAHVVPFQAQSGGFGGNGPTLIGDRMLGFRIPEQTTVECTWDPLDDSYVAFPLLMYHDDICDVRGNFRVDRKSPGLNTPQGILAGSTWCNARIEQNGNIVSSDGGYWRFNHDTSTYGPINTLAEHTIARSATLTQTKPATQGSGQVTRNWNLVAGLTGLHISDEAAPFVKSQLAFNSSRIPLGVTQQGWVATASEIWSNGTWQPVKDLLGGTTPQQATLLGILDTGLGVARIQNQTGPAKMALLIPVEVEQESCDFSKGIRFCRWLDSFSSGVLRADCADNDRDRFRVRIPGKLPTLTKINIKSFGIDGAIINGAFVNKATDGDYELDMKEENGSMVSEWILLVSDGDDDKKYNGKGTDDGPHDQTLLADFDSKIIVTFPELYNAQAEFHAQKPVGKVTLNIQFMSPEGELPPDMLALMLLHVEKMREIYRQNGIKVALVAASGAAIPQSWLDAKPEPFNWPANELNVAECADLRTQIRPRQVPSGHVRIGFVDAILKPEHPPIPRPFGYTGIKGGFTEIGEDGIVVSLSEDALRFINVTAHEVGHTLKLTHDGREDMHLMHFGRDWKNIVEDPKRFSETDFDTIKTSDYYVPLE